MQRTNCSSRLLAPWNRTLLLHTRSQLLSPFTFTFDATQPSFNNPIYVWVLENSHFQASICPTWNKYCWYEFSSHTDTTLLKDPHHKAKITNLQDLLLRQSMVEWVGAGATCNIHLILVLTTLSHFLPAANVSFSLNIYFCKIYSRFWDAPYRNILTNLKRCLMPMPGKLWVQKKFGPQFSFWLSPSPCWQKFMTIYNIHGLQALCDGPQTPTEWKSESVTDGLTRLYKVPIKTRVFLDKSSLTEYIVNM